MAEGKVKNKQRYKGVVVKKSGDKTVSVEVMDYVKHRKYEKFVKVRRKFLVHDEDNKVEVGDVVEFESCRPISRNKSFIIVNR